MAGRVRLDGQLVRDPEAPTTAASRIEVDQQLLHRASPVYIMLNKPRGLVTTAADEHQRGTVYECLSDSGLPWLAPVGRLDQASEGLLLFTNDSEWAAGLLDPARHVTKTYHVQVEGIPSAAICAQLIEGVPARDGEFLNASNVSLLRQGERNAWLEIKLTGGKNRQLRRMLEAVEHPVLRLVRTAVGDLSLGSLAKGAWRHLDAAEIMKLGARGTIERS